MGNILFPTTSLAFLHVVGMLFSPFLQSLTLLLLGFLALSRLFFAPGQSWENLGAYGRKVGFWVFGLLFLEVALGVFTAEDPTYFLERLRLRLPFLGLPLAFFLLPPLPPKVYRNWWAAVLLLMDGVALGVILNYLIHQEAIQMLLEMGKAIPTPANHIRYALLQVIALCAAAYWGWHRVDLVSRPLRLFFRVSAVFLFLFLHFLAVRSGLFSLYFVLAAWVIPYGLRQRAYGKLAALLVLMAFLPIIAVNVIPSLKHKLGYVRYDLEQLRQGAVNDQLSDSSRWISWKLGWELFREHPLTGVGAGNIRLEMDKLYTRDYPQFVKRLTPHNQFLMIMASSGLLGLGLFGLAFLIPILAEGNYRDTLLLSLHLAIFASFWMEATFETAMGVAVFLFFHLFHARHCRPSGYLVGQGREIPSRIT